MMTLGTAVCFVIAIGARSVVMEPSVPKTCFAIAAVLGVWVVLAPRRQR
jgi:hypothetical protein